MHFTVDDVVDGKLNENALRALTAVLGASELSGQEVIDSYGTSGSSLNAVWSAFGSGMGYANTPAREWLVRSGTAGGVLTREQAERAIHLAKENIINSENYMFAKWQRPWESFVNPAEMAERRGLSPNTTWAGVEIEIGASSQGSMRIIRRKLLEEFEFATADREGGVHPVESTFAPQELRKLTAANGELARYYREVLATTLVLNHTAHGMVGTHFNISTPYTRANGARAFSDNMRHVTEALCEMSGVREALFGRNPYGAAYDRGNFTEFKLFNSTRKFAAFKWYVHVMKKLIRGADGSVPFDGAARVALMCEVSRTRAAFLSGQAA